MEQYHGSFQQIDTSTSNPLTANLWWHNDMLDGASKIYLDNFEFKPSSNFHPDVDVRKKIGDNELGKVPLTTYFDKTKLNNLIFS